MFDPRYRRLAQLLVNYSCRVQPGENVLIEQHGSDDALAKELIEAVYAAGGRPQIKLWSDALERAWIKGADEKTMQLAAEVDAMQMQKMQAFIGIRQHTNLYNMSDITEAQNANHTLNYYKPVHFAHRVPNTKWVVLRYPTPAMAQLAGMPFDRFEEFYFRVCNFDYAQLSAAMQPLKELLDAADRVEIKGRDVDLKFSIKGMKSIKCDGRMNIPDGEVYTAPVKDSVEGYITYNTPSPQDGKVFDAVHLEFSHGQIVKASCANADQDAALQAIFDTDPGARYIGEFALGYERYPVRRKNFRQFPLHPRQCLR